MDMGERWCGDNVQRVIDGRLENKALPRSARESAGDHSVGGNCQSGGWYRSNLTPLRLPASVIVHRRALPRQNKACIRARAGARGPLDAEHTEGQRGYPPSALVLQLVLFVGNHLLLCAQVARKGHTHAHTDTHGHTRTHRA